MKSKQVEKKLKETAKKLECKPEDIWEEIAAGYDTNIPKTKQIIQDINNYHNSKKKQKRATEVFGSEPKKEALKRAQKRVQKQTVGRIIKK